MADTYLNLSERDKSVALLEKLDAAKTAIENMPAGGSGISFDVINGKWTKSDVNFVLNATNVKLDSTFSRAFWFSRNLETADLSGVVGTQSLNDFPILQYAFAYCPNLRSLDLSGLTSIGYADAQDMCLNCTSLTEVKLDSLKSVLQASLKEAFKGCTSLKTLSFPSLVSVSSFGTDSFNNMLSGCKNVTVHFKASMQSVIGSWSDVTKGFGGTSTTVLFDL